MKHQFVFAILFVGLTHSLWAQPVFSDADAPVIGEMYYLGFADPQGVFEPGPAGANQTWDFSHMPLSDIVSRVRYIAPQDAPDIDLFPESSIVAEITTEEFNFIGHFFELTIEGEGHFVLGATNEISIIRNMEPAVSIIHGFSFGDVCQKTVESIDQTRNGQFVFTTTDEAEVTYDGYGVLIMPDGEVYQNVARIKSVVTIVTRDQDGDESTFFQTLYTWGTNEIPVLFALFENIDGDFVQVGTNVYSPDGTFNQTDEEPQGTDRLIYPWISNREGVFDSIIIANNPSPDAIDVWLTARRTGDQRQTVKRTIPAWGFLEESSASLFPGLGSGSGYSVVLNSESDTVYGRWVTNSLVAPSGSSPSQGVAVSLEDSNENDYAGTSLNFGLLPNNESSFSAPVLVNLGSTPQSVRLRFYNGAGTLVTEIDIDDLEPMVPLAQVTSDLAPADAGDLYLYVIVRSGRGNIGQPITGCSFIFDANFIEPAIGNATVPGNVGGEMYYPWVSNRTGQYESILVANNFQSETKEVTLTATRGDGTTSMPVTRTILPNGMLRETAASLFPDMGDGPGYSVFMKASGSVSNIDGIWVTNNLASASGSSPSVGSAIKSEDGTQIGESLLFGYLPVSNGYVSAPVLLNIGDGPADVTLSFYDAQGNLLFEDEASARNLQPGVPLAVLANTLLPANTGNVQMIARGGRFDKLTGVVFVFNGAFNEPAIGNATSLDSAVFKTAL